MCNSRSIINDDQVPGLVSQMGLILHSHTSLGRVLWETAQVEARHVRGQGDVSMQKEIPHESFVAQINEIVRTSSWRPLSANFAWFLCQNREKYPPEWEGEMVCFFGTQVKAGSGDIGMFTLLKKRGIPDININVLYSVPESTLSYHFRVAMIHMP
jgi:hypothetical protein